MSPDRLLQYFEQISEAPEAVPRLRRFILDLAVRGKLLEQDPADEPIGLLIAQVQGERSRRIAEGGIVSFQTSVDAQRGRFPIPQSWGWVRLGFITNVLMGQSPAGETYNTRGDGITLINGPVEFSDGPFGITVLNQYTTAPTKLCRKGDLLLCVRGSTTGRTNVAGFDACIGRGVAALQSLYADQFIRLFVWSWRDQIIEMGRGIAFPSISREQIEDLATPLPPLTEQHRIVAKVDELMALCDELEAARAKRERRRDRLVAATLHGLNNGDPPSESGARSTFEDSARFYFNDLPRLTTRPEHIHQLRQTILNLAVRGKLIPQDPNDEPVAMLLKRIAVEKERRIKAGHFKPQHWIAPKIDASALPSLPNFWRWVHIQEVVCMVTVGYVGPTANRYSDTGIPFLRSQNVRPNRFEPIGLAYIDDAFHAELMKSELSGGDVVIVRSGNVGVSCVVPHWLGKANCADLVIVKGPLGIDSRFLCYYLNSIADSRI